MLQKIVLEFIFRDQKNVVQTFLKQGNFNKFRFVFKFEKF